MTLREGNLEAPTRHPIDWQSADYRDEGKALAEMERVFDICHGCRRCVSLCQSFPTLFDLIDATADGEVHGVDKKDYCEGRRAVLPVRPLLHDQVPVRSAASVERRLPAPDAARQGDPVRQGRGRHGREAARLDRRPRPARRHPDRRRRRSMPRTGPSRCARCCEAALDVHPDAWLPPLATRRFRGSVREEGARRPRRRRRAEPGQGRALRHLLVNYNEPGIGHDLVAVLEHNEIPYELVDKEACCGMPKLELGDLEGVAKLKAKNIPRPRPLRARGLRDPDRRSRRAR